VAEDDKTARLDDGPGAPGLGLSPLGPGTAGAADRYQIGEEVGRGGVGRVRRAVDLQLERTVAVKELLGNRPDLEARFAREARITARLQHPSIVPVYELGRRPSGEPFYSMKLIAGEPLDRLIAKADGLATRLSLLPRVIAVAEAVAFAHAQRVIHRDLKPANVLVGDYGETLVIDWGMAREVDGPAVVDAPAVSADGDASLTRVGAVVGTPAYMPPEQAAGAVVDARADVYALGAMLYHLLAGQAPYRRGSADEILAAVRAGPPPTLAAVAPDVPAELAAIVTTAMARDPKARYADARAVAEDLRRFQTGQLVGAHAYSPWQLLRRFLRRYRLVVAVAVAALVAVAVTISLSFSRILRQRQIAQAARVVAERERATADAERTRAEARENAGRLLQAAAWSERDPTATLAWLKAWAPAAADWPRGRDLAATARARGVAEMLGSCPQSGVPNRDLVYSADSRTLMAICRDGVVAWARDGQVAWTIRSEGRIRDIEIDPAGRWLAILGPDGAVTRAALANRTDLGERLLSGPVAAIIVIPSGELLSFDDHGGVEIWAWRDGPAALSWKGSVPGVPVATAGSAVLLAGPGGAHWLWDATSRRAVALPKASLVSLAVDGTALGVWLSSGEIDVLALPDLARRAVGRADEVRELALGPGGREVVAVVGADRVVWWNARAQMAERRLPARITNVRFGPGSVATVEGASGLVRHIHLDSGRMREGRGHTGIVVVSAASPDGRVVATLGSDGQVRVWPTREASSSRVVGGSRPQMLAIDGPRRRVAAPGLDGSILWLDVASAEVHHLLGHGAGVNAVAWSPSGQRLVSVGDDGEVRLWDVAAASGRVVAKQSGPVYGVVYGPSGDWFAAGGPDGNVLMFDADGGPLPGFAAPEDGAILWLGASRDGRHLATIAADDSLVIYDVGARIRRHTIRERERRPERAQFSPDGARLAVTDIGGGLRIIDVKSGALRELTRRDELAYDLAWAGDGSRLVASFWDGAVVACDMPAEACRVVGTHHGQVYDVAITANGRIVASASGDGTARVWDLDSGTSRSLELGDDVVRRIALAPDGSFLAAAGENLGLQLFLDPLAGAPPADPGAFGAWLDEVTAVTVADLPAP
jgi:WD40 repeat protein